METMRPAVRAHWPEIGAACAPLVVFAHIVFGGRVLYWGLPALQFVPWRTLVSDALRAGQLPLWTPLLGMGAPVLANYQSAALYPPNWLALVAPAETTISLLAVMHLSWGALGMARLARQLRLSDFGVAVAALSFGLSGYLTGRLWFITINNAIVWLPWIVKYALPLQGAFETQQARRSALRQWLALVVLITLQLLAGHAQSVFYTLLVAYGWVGWHSLQNGRGQALRRLIENLAFLTLALALAIGVSSLQLLPTYELLRLSPRADAADYEFAMTYSLWPWRALTFLAPTLFGHPADGNYWGYATYWEDNAYMALIPVILAAYAAWRSLRGRLWPAHSETRENGPLYGRVGGFCMLLGIVSVALALGRNTSVFPFLYQYVPGFGLFQAPARMLIGYTFALSLLAGLGAHLWSASERKRYWARLGIAASLAAAVLGLAGAQLAQGRLITIAQGISYAAILAVGAFGLLLFQPERPGRWRLLALAFLAADLGYAAVRLNPTADRSLYLTEPAQGVVSGRLFQASEDEYNARFRIQFRFDDFRGLNAGRLRNSLLANLTALDAIETANNFDPLLTERYTNYVKQMEGRPALLDLANVSDTVNATGVVTARFGAPARIRIVYDAQFVQSAEAALTAIASPGFDPDSLVVLETPEVPQWPAFGWGSHSFITTVDLARPGYVVVSDLYYPGWVARVDGQPKPVLAANYAFRAVAVPAGEHSLMFEYAPASVSTGLAVSTLSFLILVGAGWLAFRAAPKHPQS